jgi:hypothetical protein
VGLHMVSLSAICLAVGTLLFSPFRINLTNELEAAKRLGFENSQTRCPLTEALINVNPEELSALIEPTYSDNGEEVLEVHQENIVLNQDGSVSVDLTLQNKAHVSYGATFSIETGTIVSEVIVSLVNTGENTSLPLTPQITQHLGTITFCPGSHLRLHLNKFGFNVKDASYLLFLDAMTALSVFGGAGYLPEQPVDLAKNIAIDEILAASGLDTIVFSRQLQNAEYLAAFRTLAEIIVEKPQIWADFLLREYGIRISSAALQKLSAGLYLFLGAKEIFPILRDLIQKPREVQVDIDYSPNIDDAILPPETAPTSQLYNVAFVASSDTLNVRSGAGVDFSVVGQLAYDAKGIEITGEGETIGRALWVPIQFNEIDGWVNRYYLVEQVDPNAFCNDSRVQILIDQLKIVLTARDGNGLKNLVGPVRGLLLRNYWWNNEVRLFPDEISNFFSDTTLRDWGVGDGSGFQVTGSVPVIIVPLLENDLLRAEEINCNTIIGAPGGNLQLPPEYKSLNFYSIYRPAPDEDNFADWGTWVIGVENWDGEPVISYMVHYTWEI